MVTKRRPASSTTTAKAKTAAVRDESSAAPATTSAQPLKVKWRTEPQAHDYPAARSYLSLLAGPNKVTSVEAALRRATVVNFKAKDILRASRLPLLPPDNKHVASDLAEIAAGKELSPCLLVRGNLAAGTPAQIADGYHRVCASYHVDENTDIPVKIAAL